MSTVILVSIIVFLVITLLLVALLLFAKAKLMPSGNVTIDINNGEKKLEVATGGTLLSTLAENKIFLPSACGGKGNCGMCKCQVISGGGSILPTEVGFFSRKEQLSNWRLPTMSPSQPQWICTSPWKVMVKATASGSSSPILQ